MANLTFNVAGVSLSINTADADLINELRRFNNNLEIVQELLSFVFWLRIDFSPVSFYAVLSFVFLPAPFDCLSLLMYAF